MSIASLWKFAGAVVLLLAPLLAGTAAPPTERVALVIGNAAYRDQALPNPRNDAQAMAQLLTKAGFAVELRTDLGRSEMLQSIARFGERLDSPQVRLAVFYYAGHGFQQDWRNFLVPVDARVRNASDVSSQTVDVSELLRRMQASPQRRSHLIILDACRDDPFAGSWRPTQKGLSQFDAPSGSLVAYATAPGRVAFDGPVGGNGLYTHHLLRELGVADSSVEDALKRVRLNVRMESRGRQIPWEMASLEESLYLFGPRAGQLTEADAERRFERELSAWSHVRQTTDLAALAAFIRAYPSGNAAELAQARLNRLLAEEHRRAEPGPPAAPVSPSQPAIVAGLPPLAAAPATGSAIGVTAAALAPVVAARVEPTPFFGGSHEHQRAYRVGDSFTHRVLERGSGRELRQQTLKVTAVDPDADRVEFNGGEYVSDLMGNIIANPRGAMSTPRQFYPAELIVGKRWRSEFEQARVSGLKYRFAYQLRVAGRERITVPAGTFDTYRIEATGWNVGLQAYLKRTIWVAPGMAPDIAHETFVRLRNGQIEQDDRQELLAYSAR